MSGLCNPDLLGAILTAVLVVPPRPPAAPDLKSLIVGFDTEWEVLPDGSAGPLLSVQFATLDPGGQLMSRCYDPPGDRLTPESLARLLDKFLREIGYEFPSRRVRIVLLAHFAQAEMSMFVDPFRDITIEQIGKAHHGSLGKFLVGEKLYAISICDTFAYFAVGLEKLGKAVGLEKLDEDRTDLARLKQADRSRFERYAVRDAEIVHMFFSRVREDALRRWDLDILRYKTVGGFTAALFKHRYLRRNADKTRVELEQRPRRLKSGEWTHDLKDKTVFNGDLARRSLACNCYHGGWAEAFVHGLVPGPLVEWDVVSLYPAAARDQPLPNDLTEWQEVREIDHPFTLEGFGTVLFTFPNTEKYPCLPCRRLGSDRLVFPLSGESHCTFVEMRAALARGATLKLVRGFGFSPGPNEIEHDVRRFQAAVMALKANLPKGSVEYEFTKLLANALVGKLAEHRTPNALLRVERDARRAGFPGLGKVLNASPSLRVALQGKPQLGSVFHPEWATLILGRARSLMADFVSLGAYLVSTDSVLLPREVGVSCPALDRLRAVGSNFAEEIVAGSALIGRTRLYALFVEIADLTPELEKRVLARNDKTAVVKGARHGTIIDKAEFGRLILEAKERGEFLPVAGSKRQLLAAETAIRLGLPLNAALDRLGTVAFKYDNKRELINPNVNPMRDFTWTRPHPSLEALEQQERQHARQTRAPRAKHDRRTTLEVLKRLRNGESVRAIETATGVPKSTVQDLRTILKHTARDELLKHRFGLRFEEDE